MGDEAKREVFRQDNEPWKSDMESVGEIFFPLPFLILIALRQFKLFDPSHLKVLDSSEYEEIGAPQQNSSFGFNGELREAHNIPMSVVEISEDEFYDAEIMDEITTSRGELKLRTVSVKEDISHMSQVYPENSGHS